jgi:beta-lactamase superfamily II metal-dependent hydrolase
MLRRAWLVLAGVLLAATLGAGRAAAESPLRVDFISVGQGDGALVTSPAGKTVLIDGGPREGAAGLIAFLRARRVGKIDLILLTHRHDDHFGGLAAVVRTFGAKMFMDAPFLHPSPAYEALLKTLEANGVLVRNAERGREIDLGGGARMTLLTPPDPPLTGTRSDVNANGVVLRVDYRKVGVLFAADAEAPTEAWLLRTGAPLRAQVLKVAHHGSRYSSTAKFVRAARPSVAVISAGPGNVYHHPDGETLARFERLPARVYRTDLDGTVTMETDGTRIEMRTQGGRRETVASR